MDRTPQIQALRGELDIIEDRLRPFSTPRLADNAPPFTQGQSLFHELLMRRRAEIIVEIVKREDGRL